jgi:hypothetical protein
MDTGSRKHLLGSGTEALAVADRLCVIHPSHHSLSHK